MLSFNTVNGLYKSSRKSNMLSFFLLFFIKCSVANFLNETTLNTCLLNVKLQINCEIFITFSPCIHVIFESCTINSLGKIMDATTGVSIFYSYIVGKLWTLSGLTGSIAHLESFVLLI